MGFIDRIRNLFACSGLIMGYHLLMKEPWFEVLYVFRPVCHPNLFLYLYCICYIVSKH